MFSLIDEANKTRHSHCGDLSLGGLAVIELFSTTGFLRHLGVNGLGGFRATHIK